jgi:DNA-binding PadR family transcriptional regulator
MKQTIPTLELALAGLLAQKPQSGYDLRKTFASTAMRHYSDSPGSIYPALRRLEARGWIAGEGDPRAIRGARGRRVFALTAKGKESLRVWMELPVSREDVMWRLPELMLRFAYMDGHVPRSAACRFLGDFARELAGYVAELRTQLEAMQSKAALHTGVLAFESGILAMEAQLEWAQRARARLTEES